MVQGIELALATYKANTLTPMLSLTIFFIFTYFNFVYWVTDLYSGFTPPYVLRDHFLAVLGRQYGVLEIAHRSIPC